MRELAAAPVRDNFGITKMVAIIVPNDQWSETVFWNHLRASIPRTFWPVQLVMVQDLPKGGNGKVDRAKLGALINAAWFITAGWVLRMTDVGSEFLLACYGPLAFA